MQINSTSEYLQTLDEIAEFIEKENLSVDELRALSMKKLAVKKYEMQEVGKYPAKEALIHDFKKCKFYLN